MAEIPKAEDPAQKSSDEELQNTAIIIEAEAAAREAEEAKLKQLSPGAAGVYRERKALRVEADKDYVDLYVRENNPERSEANKRDHHEAFAEKDKETQKRLREIEAQIAKDPDLQAELAKMDK